MACCGNGCKLCSQTARLMVMLTMTFGFFLVEIVYGYMTNSMALVADSFHMLSDVLALVVAFYCMKISKRRSETNTFGWVRAEILGALVNAVFLLALCFSIFVEAITRLIDTERIKDPLKILIVGVIGLVVNVIGIFMFHGHSSGGGHQHSHGDPSKSNDHNHALVDASDDPELFDSYKVVATESHTVTLMKSMSDSPNGAASPIKDNGESDELLKKNEPEINGDTKQGKPMIKDKKRGGSAAQMNMHGVFLHILGDAFGSLIVIITAIVCWRLPENDFLNRYLDPGLSLIMVCIITLSTLPLLKESALILLQTPPKYVDVQSIKKQLLEMDGVVAVHEFHVWRLAGLKIIATIHIRFRTLQDYLNAADKIKGLFHEHEIHSTTIQPEFTEMGEADEGNESCALTCARQSCDATMTTCCGPPPLVKSLQRTPPTEKTTKPLRTVPSASSIENGSTTQSPTSSKPHSQSPPPSSQS